MKRIIDDKNPLLVESADIADRSINRCDAIISDLLDFTRICPLEMASLPIDRWLGVMLDEYPLPEGISLRRDLASAVDVWIDSESLRRSFLNLLDNACQAMIGDAHSAEQAASAPAGGHVLTVASRVSHDRIEVTISDTGPGIPDTIRDNIFEPLYSTKNFGVGLGLSIVMQIAEQHGGGVECSESKKAGVVFTLWLPIDSDALRRVS